MRTSFVTMFTCSLTLACAIGWSQTGTNPASVTATAKSEGNQPQTPQTGKTNNNSKANQTGYSPNDNVSPPASPQQFNIPATLKCGDKSTVYDVFNQFITEKQSNAECILSSIASANSAQLPDTLIHGKNNGIILHVVTWTSAPKYKPTGGAWGFYRVKSAHGDLKQQLDLSGTPYLYGTPHVYLIEFNYFDNKMDTAKVTLAYDIQTKARQKQNQSDFNTLVSSLLKISGGGTKQADVNLVPDMWGTVFEVVPTVPVPYDIVVTTTLGDSKGVTATTSSIGCTPSPCSFSKTVTLYDTEYWDVSLGLAIPGPVETTYKSTTSSTGSTSVTPSKVTHTDAYAFADFYVFQHFAQAPAFLSAIPHVNAGIPITSQSLHRPYVGLAENIGFLTSKVKLNIPFSIFAGPVFMKQQIVSPPGTQMLKWDHATKMMYGLELPISSITNYMKGGNNSSKNTTSKTSGQTQPASDNSAQNQLDAPAASAQNTSSVQLFAPVSPRFDQTPTQADRLTQIRSRSTTKSVQLVRFNADSLVAKDVNVTVPGGTILTLSKTAAFDTANSGPAKADSRNFVWTGVLKEQNQAGTTLVSVNGQISGSITGTNDLYRIEPVGGGVEALVQIDSTKFPKDEPANFKAKAPVSPKTHENATEYKADAPRIQIDVLVTYTQLAKAATADIDGLIALAVAEANQSYVNSGIAIHLNLVDSFQVSYSEAGKTFETILADFVAMPDVNKHRDDSGADLAVLIMNQSDYCGLADSIGADPSTAFAIVYYDCATGYYSFAHELGHLMGARHDEQDDPTSKPFPYGHGFLHLTSPPEWRTIMAYDCPDHCNRLQYWSNPGLNYEGQPMGTVNTNDDARVLNSTARTVAAFRNRPANPPSTPAVH